MNSSKILFIINPISGTSKKQQHEAAIRSAFADSAYHVEIKFSEYPSHAHILAKAAAAEGYYAVVAVGGDGTINEVASALCDSDTILGILPSGSGNGLARHLEIPIDLEKSLAVVKSGHFMTLDYCTANGRPFFCTCGVGFDAQVSMKFAQSNKRGALTYVKSAIAEYLKYRSQIYKITTPQGVITEKAFIIACGNASQYGNNAYITPNANIQDGLIDVTMILPITPLDTALLGILLFARHIDQDTNIISFRTPELTIERKTSGIMHLDGELLDMPARISIKCHHNGIRIFTPEKIKNKATFFSAIEAGFWDFVNSVRKELNI